MGIIERKKREKEKRKNSIINAAEKVIFKKGYLDATMDEIAEEAELSKGTLYLYFKSKEELFAAIVLRALKKLNDLFLEFIEKEKKGIDKILSLGKAYYKFFKEYNNYFNIISYHESRPSINFLETQIFNECINEGKRNLEIMVEAIKYAINDGSIRKNLDPIKLATCLRGQSMGVFMVIEKEKEYLENSLNIKEEEIVNFLFDLLKFSMK